jgi:hypothetical protein
VTLKTKNAPYAVTFTVLYYVGFALANGLNWSFAKSLTIGKDGASLDSPLLSLAFFVLTLILTYLLPSGWKHRLIYTRWTNALPGSRAFTELIDKDERISRHKLVDQYGQLPEQPSEQNVLWYKIYKSKQAEPVVLNSNGRWLLFRDLFAISLILLVPSTVYTFCNSGAAKGFVYLAVALLVVACLFLCARNTGERFACNVLAR